MRRPQEAQGTVDDDQGSNYAQGTNSPGRFPHAQTEGCYERGVDGAREDPQRPGRSAYRGQLANRLRGRAVALPLHRDEDGRGDVERRREDSADEQDLSSHRSPRDVEQHLSDAVALPAAFDGRLVFRAEKKSSCAMP